MGEQTSPRIAALAAKGLADPASLKPQEIREVCASALTQAEDSPQPEPVEPGPGFHIQP